MRPNTPHLVLTPKAAICHGGHFYASSTLRHTCHGVLHTFVACSLLTNTEHTTASRELLRRLLFYYCKAFLSDYLDNGSTGNGISDDYKGNIPDIFTFEGLLDVLSLCNLMELANVTHYKSYTDEGIGTSERHKMITGRACARKIRKWLAANVEIHDPHDVSSLRSLDNDVFYPYLASQTAALVHYKMRAPASEAQGHVEFQLEDLVVQIDRAFFQDTQFKAHYDLALDPKTFDWVGTAYQVRPVKGHKVQLVFEEGGENFDDREWLVAQRDLRVIGGAQVVQDEDKAGQPPKKRARI
jgi:hypothetical protein